MSLLFCPVNMLDQRKYFGQMKKNILILTFILFSFLVPDFEKPHGIMLTRGTLPKLRNLSSKFSDPNGSYWGMNTYLKTRVRLQRKIISRNFLAKLQKKKVGTPEIEGTAMRNIYGSEHRNVDNARNK